VHDLRDRIAQLKLKFTENEIKVNQAAEAVRDADALASRAEQVIHLCIDNNDYYYYMVVDAR